MPHPVILEKSKKFSRRQLKLSRNLRIKDKNKNKNKEQKIKINKDNDKNRYKDKNKKNPSQQNLNNLLTSSIQCKNKWRKSLIILVMSHKKLDLD